MLTYSQCSPAGLLVDEPDIQDMSPSLVHRLDRQGIFHILELAERSGVILRSDNVQELSLAMVLDAYDNEFQLAHLLSTPVNVILNGHGRIACPAADGPERYLALVCAETLLHAGSSRIRGKIRFLLHCKEIPHVGEPHDPTP